MSIEELKDEALRLGLEQPCAYLSLVTWLISRYSGRGAFKEGSRQPGKREARNARWKSSPLIFITID
jgi:hypothetical protein